MSLKNLLLIKYEELALEQYYRYDVLKMRIHRDMCEEPSNKFLDLVS